MIQVPMKQFTVIIDRSSTYIIVDATSEKEAKQKVWDDFNVDQTARDDFNYWIGDVTEGEF